MPRRFEVLPARVAHVAGQHHSFVIAQQQHGGASRVGGLLFEFVHQPQQRQHVVAAVENVADHRQLVVSVAPPAVAVDHAVGLEERRKTPEIAVKVGRDEQFRGLREFPGTSLDGVRRDAEEVCAPARTDLDRAASVRHHADAPPLVGGRCIGALFRVVDELALGIERAADARAVRKHVAREKRAGADGLFILPLHLAERNAAFLRRLLEQQLIVTGHAQPRRQLFADFAAAASILSADANNHIVHMNPSSSERRA